MPVDEKQQNRDYYRFGSCTDNVNFIMMRQALSHFFKHAGIIYGFSTEEDYSSFFYFLHVELTLIYGIETTH